MALIIILVVAILVLRHPSRQRQAVARSFRNFYYSKKTTYWILAVLLTVVAIGALRSLF